MLLLTYTLHFCFSKFFSILFFKIRKVPRIFLQKVTHIGIIIHSGIFDRIWYWVQAGFNKMMMVQTPSISVHKGAPGRAFEKIVTNLNFFAIFFVVKETQLRSAEFDGRMVDGINKSFKRLQAQSNNKLKIFTPL